MYDKASIALIPSGTKASKLYSVLPANGDGDFTHSRSLTTATRVNKDGLIESVAADVPRLDYPLTNGVVGDCPHLLLEPSRINLIADSDDMTGFSFTNAAIDLNSGIAPDGSNTAIKFKDNNGGGTGAVRMFKTYTVSISTDYQMSVFMKANGVNFAGLRTGSFNPPANADTVFNLSNGTIHSQASDHTRASIENYGNGWYRCSIGFETGSSVTSGNFVVILANNNGNPNSVSIDGRSNVLIWGAQFEAGSYTTSHIPTSGIAETRSADECNSAGTSAEFNNSEGVLFAEIAALANDGTNRTIEVSSGSGNRLSIQLRDVDNQIRFFGRAGGSSQLNQFISVNDATAFNKIALKYEQDNVVCYINGVKIFTDPSFGIFVNLSELDFAQYNLSSPFYGKCKQLIYFNEALSDSELQTLTS